MKRFFLLLVLAVFNFSVSAQNYQHKSVDISYPLDFYVSQQQSFWCWAACNQMLLKAQGIDESQPNQVIKLFGELVNQGAGDNYEMAMQVLGGEYVNSTGDTVQVVPYVSYLGQNYDDPIVIINHLEQGIPLVMATQSHGRVCVGVDYTTNGEVYQITYLRLLDPANPKGVITYSMQQLLSEGFMGIMTYDID